jgi:hypothetical protein
MLLTTLVASILGQWSPCIFASPVTFNDTNESGSPKESLRGPTCLIHTVYENTVHPVGMVSIAPFFLSSSFLILLFYLSIRRTVRYVYTSLGYVSLLVALHRAPHRPRGITVSGNSQCAGLQVPAPHAPSRPAPGGP